MGRSPPGFHPPVSRFRTPASFSYETVTFQIWFQTVETRGGYGVKRCFFSRFVIFGVGVVSRLYLSCVLLYSHESWQSDPLSDALQLCEV